MENALRERDKRIEEQDAEGRPARPGHGREPCQDQDEAGEDDDVLGVFLRTHDGGGDVT